jgi:hypothetical protein
MAMLKGSMDTDEPGTVRNALRVAVECGAARLQKRDRLHAEEPEGEVFWLPASAMTLDV